MRFDDPRTEWRIDAVERKANDARSRLYEIDEAKRNVDSLEHTVRELRAEIDGLRGELSMQENRIAQLEHGAAHE